MSGTPKVIGVTLVDAPSADNDTHILALFSCELNSIRLDGCTLVRFGGSGIVRSFPPRFEKRRGKAHAGVTIIDDKLHDEITAAAHRAYTALAGAQ